MIKKQVDQVFALPLTEALTPPNVFRDHELDEITPTLLGEWAAYVAANREFVAEQLQIAQHTYDLVQSMQKALEDEAEDGLNEELSSQAGYLINRGFAAQERMASAKLSQVERSVHLRAGRLQVERLGAMVRQLRHVHGEWRAAEFTLDRMVRITQVRLTLSER
jgi:hypothetical protein